MFQLLGVRSCKAKGLKRQSGVTRGVYREYSGAYEGVFGLSFNALAASRPVAALACLATVRRATPPPPKANPNPGRVSGGHVDVDARPAPRGDT
jgi:hypothetical protein